RPPLLRATVLTLDPAAHVVIIALHHLVADGWTVGLLRSELEQTYNRCIRGEPSSDVPPAMQYGEFAQWQREQFRDVPEDVEAYWAGEWATYGGAQVVPADLGLARPDPPDRGGSGY